MFTRTETDEQLANHEQLKVREEVQITLRKLQMLKSKIAELRDQCEELRELSSHAHAPRSETTGTTLRCSKCGRAIEPGQEIVIKDSDGTETGRYHRECFKLFWV
jgi:hypothetical protein